MCGPGGSDTGSGSDTGTAHFKRRRTVGGVTATLEQHEEGETIDETDTPSDVDGSTGDSTADEEDEGSKTTQDYDQHIGTGVSHELATVDVATGYNPEDVYPARHGLLHDGESISVGRIGLNVGGGGVRYDAIRRANNNRRGGPSNELLSGNFEVITTDEVCKHITGQFEKYLIVDINEQSSSRTHREFLHSLLSYTRRTAIPRRYRENQTYLVQKHDIENFKHYHAIHVCAWSKYACRCGRLDSFKQFKLCNRKAYPISRLATEAVKQILLYHLGGQRISVYCEVGGQQRRLCHQDGSIFEDDSCRPPAPRMVEKCNTSLEDRSEWQDGRDADTEQMGGPSGKSVGRQVQWRTKIAGLTAGNDSTSSQYPKGPCTEQMWQSLLIRLNHKRNAVQFGDVIVVLKRLLLTPMTGIPYSSDWFDVPRMASINPTGLVFDSAIRTFRGELNKLNIAGAYEFQTSDGARPVYGAGCTEAVTNMYWNLNQSLYMLLDLLHFQFDGDFSRVLKFLLLNYNVYEKVTGKKNCLCIIGPANSGKNFWVDGLCDFSLNPGKMENPNRCNVQFAFSQCHNRRILKWDECSFDHYFDPTLLNLLQGKPFMANMKYKNPEAVIHTPLFVMANVYPFSNETRFNDRVYLTDRVDLLMFWSRSRSRRSP